MKVKVTELHNAFSFPAAARCSTPTAARCCCWADWGRSPRDQFRVSCSSHRTRLNRRTRHEGASCPAQASITPGVQRGESVPR
ncbi:hypothetical protein NQZ68_026781 [Dissostichus eleginoides]|nr:hypothetical protein NQZ68_026781 [Dissostichus eleginoides]